MNGKSTLIIALLTTVVSGVADGHIDNHLLPEGCGSCHTGHGEKNQPMLSESVESFCFNCHGSDAKRSVMVSEGKLSPMAQLADLEVEFNKQYGHPVNRGFGHSPVERLPSASGETPGHAECVDCHNPHLRMGAGGRSQYEVAGYTITGNYLDVALHEYEICLKCHVSYIGLESERKEITAEFSPAGISQHSVTRPISTRELPSLVNFDATIMKCSDCHTNDNSDGPKGPHGSRYPYLLSGNYDIDVFADENPYAYEFC